MKLEFESKVEKFDNDRVYGRHFRVPEDVAQEMMQERDDKRVIINVNGSEDLHAGIMPKKTFHYILLNKENCKKLGLEIGDKISVAIRPDNSRYGMSLPREFEEFLIQDDTFSRHFENLTPGKKRNLIYLVSKLKSSDKRIEKTAIIAQHLARRNGDLDFKELHEDFKQGF